MTTPTAADIERMKVEQEPRRCETCLWYFGGGCDQHPYHPWGEFLEVPPDHHCVAWKPRTEDEA